jgi:hypothetical protein
VVNLRRTIYLTIMSSLDFEEAGHKLMKIQLAPGQVRAAAATVVWGGTWVTWQVDPWRYLGDLAGGPLCVASHA